MSKQFQLYFYKVYMIITKSKSSVSFVVATSIFVIRLTNGAQFSNPTSVAALCPII